MVYKNKLMPEPMDEEDYNTFNQNWIIIGCLKSFGQKGC
jgi:hypothetical protein